MKGIDIIIPVHKYDENVMKLLQRCLTSLAAMAVNGKNNGITTEIQVVGPSTLPTEEIMNLIKWNDEFESFNVIENTDALDFASQVNMAVNECHNDYFMIVEFDDMVNEKWLTMATPYMKAKRKCSMFLPLVEVYSIHNAEKPTHYINEISWSSSFSESELGVLSVSALQDYCNFNITGAIIKKSDFVKAGGLKPSIKLSFGYELLLRMTNLYKEVFVIPKVGYFHFTNREDSLTAEYHKSMSPEEGSWWIKLATEEYQYKKDRNKVYNPDNNA
jgi:hypothetical protein